MPTMRPELSPWLLLLCLAAPTFASGGDRFKASLILEPRHTSEDGRFTATAHARREQAAATRDGRFVFKTSAASCDPLDDSLFRNGFEAL